MEASFFEVVSFLTIPFLVCLVLVGIHCYLGFHVLERGVIFVDLSLAQIAALGSTFALLFQISADSLGNYFVSLGFTLLAATLFALGRRHEDKIPQEALIGITYALGSAAVVLCMDRLHHGAEHVKSLLVGQILWASWGDLAKITIIYSIVGAIHYFFRNQFFAASRGRGNDKGMWDFCFYALFGVVITSSVKIAGILQVFSYLIVPSVVANMFFDSLKNKLIFGWVLGFLLSLVGIIWSYKSDLPSGAAIVVCFTLVPILLVLGLNIFRHKHVS